jgi:predicted nucleic acid-binding protein
MSAFVDSSALVKLYADERGHEVVRAVPTLVVAQAARFEVVAAIWVKHRMAELSRVDATVLAAAFEADYHGTATDPPRFVIVSTTVMVLETAARMVRMHDVRACESLSLAAAVLAASADPECREFVSYNQRLRSAAFTEGFTLVPE